MTQLHCARCWNPVGEMHTGHINTGLRLICAKCDDKKMTDGIPHQLPEFLRQSPAINRQMAIAGREDYNK